MIGDLLCSIGLGFCTFYIKNNSDATSFSDFL